MLSKSQINQAIISNMAEVMSMVLMPEVWGNSMRKHMVGALLVGPQLFWDPFLSWRATVLARLSHWMLTFLEPFLPLNFFSRVPSRFHFPEFRSSSKALFKTNILCKSSLSTLLRPALLPPDFSCSSPIPFIWQSFFMISMIAMYMSCSYNWKKRIGSLPSGRDSVLVLSESPLGPHTVPRMQ